MFQVRQITLNLLYFLNVLLIFLLLVEDKVAVARLFAGYRKDASAGAAFPACTVVYWYSSRVAHQT